MHKAYIRRLVVRAIEDAIVLIGLFCIMWLIGVGVSTLFNLFSSLF